MINPWSKEEEKMLVEEYRSYFMERGSAWGFCKHFARMTNKNVKQIENKMNRMKNKGLLQPPFRWVSE